MLDFFPLHPGQQSALQRRWVLGFSAWLLLWGVLVALTSPWGSVRCLAALTTVPIALLAYAAVKLHRSSAAAWWLVIASCALVSVMALQGLLHQTTIILVLTCAVLMAALSLGWIAALLSAAWVIVLGGWLVMIGQVEWQQVIVVSYVLASVLAVIYGLFRKKTQQVQGLRSSLDALGAERQQLDVLFQAVEQNPEIISIVDSKGCLVYANHAFELRTGYAREEVIGQPSRKVSLTGMSTQTYAEMRAVVEAGLVWKGVVRNTLKDGAQVDDAVRIAPVVDKNQALSYLVETRQDISEKLEAQTRIRYLQEHDSVTELLNQQGLLASIDSMVASDSKQSSSHSWHLLLLLELDRFQVMVTARGTEWVRELLQGVVVRLQAVVPHGAQLARTADGQFAVVVARVGKSRPQARLEGYGIAQEVHAALTVVTLAPTSAAPEQVKLSCSIGFTVFPFVEVGLQHDKSDHVLRRATVALSQARHQGGGQVSAYSEALDESVRRRMDLEKDLGIALQEGHLQLFLQPQVDVYGKVFGLEALVRWKHPQKGMISPGEFIPVAEDCGLIVPMGDWVLEQVCHLLNDPRVQAAGYNLSVNVSAVQFQDKNFVDRVRSMVQGCGVNPQRLVLEVTESFLLVDIDQAIQKMISLRALGIQFALDDFGTGFSSLAYLARLPIQEIKLDQVFIRDLTPGSQAGVLVEAVMMIAKSKGLRVVAEGVEHGDQAQLLQALEPSVLCQGYWFSKPIDAQQWLANPVLANSA